MAEKTKPNKNQQKAIKHGSGAILVVAGAGTGKTTVITERIKNLLLQQKAEEDQIKPNQILALTFTEKAAVEMLERLGNIMPLGYEEPWVCTFHAFADRILRAEGLEIGLDPSYKILSYPEQWLLLRKNLFKMKLEYFRPLGNPTKFISAILKFISRLQDENILPKDFATFAQNFEGDKMEKVRWQELSHIYQYYEELKIKNSKMDFGDLITWIIKLFEERPNILKKYQIQFRHILVDEFQDTNFAQYELIKQLFPARTPDKKRSLLVVGDDSQSIYKFRGAAVSNILQFMEDYPKAEMITLLENYRSHQKILDPAYGLIANNNPDTLESKLGISKKLIAMNKEKGVEPQVILCPTFEDEVQFVIKKIYEILGNEPEYTYKDIAILARANNHLDPFVIALRQNGLPYQIVGNHGLYDRDEIRDILALLRVIVNPLDSVSLYRALNINTLKIPYDEIAHLLSQAKFKKTELWEIIKSSKNQKIVDFCELVKNSAEKITERTPVEFVYNLVHSINYILQFTEEETVENNLCIKNLNLFLERIKKFEAGYYTESKEVPTIVDLMDYLDLMIEAGDNPAQAEIEDIDTINLLTVHAAKGLEFPVVFVVNMVEGRFPTRNRADLIEIPENLIKETLPTGDEHIQEERRLCYVAATRAKKYLIFTLARDYGGKRERNASGFLDEMGLKITEAPPTGFEKEETQTSLFGVESGYKGAKATKILGTAPKKFSFTQYSSYKTCPLQFKYKYILNIPTLPSHNLSFGSTIHSTLRDLYQKVIFNETVSTQDLLNIYEKNWEPLGYLNEEHRKIRFESGKKLLENFWQKHKNDGIKPIGLEKNFEVKVGNVLVFGKIDRIDELPKGGVEIIDYKTGEDKDQKEVDKDEQVSFYAIGAKEALGLEPKKLTYYYIETEEKVSTSRTQADLNKTKENIKETSEKIKKNEFDPTPGYICNWCDYKDICPHAQKD